MATKKKTAVKKTAEVKNSVDKTLAEKVKNLKAMTEQINAQAGKKVSGFLDDPDIVSKLRVEYLSTPCDALNEVISGKANEGGFPVGKMTVIAGQPDSGKTSLVLETIAQAQKNDPTFICLWIETENSLEESYISKTFGIDMSRFILLGMDAKNGGEAVLDRAEAYINTGAINMMVINSMKALIPKANMNKPISEDTMATQARMNSKFCDKFVSLIDEYHVTTVIVTHLSTAIGVMSRD